MPAQRIKGQEVELLLVVDGVAKDTITTIRNFEIEADIELLSEGYLGETTERKDEIYKGCKGNFDLHFDSRDVLDMVRQVIDRARRRVPGTQINIKVALNFPSGQRVRILIPNAFFGPIPLNFGSRSDYGTIKLEYGAEDFDLV